MERPLYDALKRGFDLLVAVTLLPVLGLTSAVVFLLMRRDSPGPLFFRQQRVGKDGHVFTIYKFRTMHADSPVYEHSPADDERDPRVTRLGRFLRKASIDELPQLWNVLRGEMSLVGPRPEMPFLVEWYSPRERRRLEVKPGITGSWQVSPARRDAIHANLKYDRYYLRYRSLCLDLWLIYKTIGIVVRGTRYAPDCSTPENASVPHPQMAAPSGQLEMRGIVHEQKEAT